VLVFQAKMPCSVTVGALGEQHFAAGYYCYVGSAHGGGGLQARVARHLSIGKSKRWHMDYLRDELHAVAVWWHAGAERQEHRWVEQMPDIALGAACKGFGASDSRHATHLFFSANTPCFQLFKARISSKATQSILSSQC